MIGIFVVTVVVTIAICHLSKLVGWAKELLKEVNSINNVKNY